MSRWTVLRSTLVAILFLTLIGPVAAEKPNPWRSAPAAEAPMPRQQPTGFRLNVPTLGPAGRALDYAVPLNTVPVDHEQLFNFYLGLFDGPIAEAPKPRLGTTGVIEREFGIEFSAGLPFSVLRYSPQATTPMPQRASNHVDVPFGIFVEEYSLVPPAISPGSFVPCPAPAGCASSLCAPCAPMARPLPLTFNERNFTWSYQVVPMIGTTGWWLNEVRVPQAIPACGGMGKLAGTWCRDLGDAVITARFTGDEMVVGMTQNADGVTVQVTITADYALTKEGLIHGVVTGIDLNAKSGLAIGDSPSSQEIAESGAELQKLVDCPFSFRVKLTSAGIMVSNIKIAAEGMGKEELALACGLFKPAVDGKLPTPKTMKTRATSRCEPPPCLPPAPLQVVTQPIADAVPTMPPPSVPGMVIPASTAKPGCCDAPRVVSAPQSAWAPPKPANVPPGDFGMMADVFGQMIGGPSPLMPPCQVQPAAVTSVAPRPLPAPPMPSALTRPITGTWVREIGPLMYVITIDNDHLTIRSTASAEVAAGKVMCEGMTITADYHLMRDGTTLLGLITSADAILEGDVPPIDDLPQLGAELERVQKALTDKPLAMSVRIHGDTLVVGNVRLAEMEGEGPRAFPLAALGGRYTNTAGRPLSRPKPTKVNDLPHYRPTTQAPPPYYPVPADVYVPQPAPPRWNAPASYPVPYGDVPPPPYDRIPAPAPGSNPAYGVPPQLLLPPPPLPATEMAQPEKRGKKKSPPTRAIPVSAP